MVGYNLPVVGNVDQAEGVQPVLLIDVHTVVDVLQREDNARPQTAPARGDDGVHAKGHVVEPPCP